MLRLKRCFRLCGRWSFWRFRFFLHGLATKPRLLNAEDQDDERDGLQGHGAPEHGGIAEPLGDGPAHRMADQDRAIEPDGLRERNVIELDRVVTVTLGAVVSIVKCTTAVPTFSSKW